MYISSEVIRKHLMYNLAGTVFLAVFGAVYEAFSHGVYSYHMIYAFAVPLVLGAIPDTWILIKEYRIRKRFLRITSCAEITVAEGCVIQGVLDIYGTTNEKVIVYLAAGIVLLIMALLSLRKKNQAHEYK